MKLNLVIAVLALGLLALEDFPQRPSVWANPVETIASSVQHIRLKRLVNGDQARIEHHPWVAFMLEIGPVKPNSTDSQLGSALFEEETIEDNEIIVTDEAESDDMDVVGESTKNETKTEKPTNQTGNHVEITFCGGSLIDPEWVLTASHCLERINSTKFVFGLDRIENFSTSIVTRGIQDVYVMNRNDEDNDGGDDDPNKADQTDDSDDFSLKDLALVRLDSPVKLSEKIQTIEINRNESLVSEDLFGVVAGFGRISDDSSFSSQLLSAKFQTNPQCLASWIWPDTFCAWSRTQNTCNGDSGSGLILNPKGPNRTEDKPLLIGVLYGGWDCSPEGGNNFFTNVARYSDWIDSVMKEARVNTKFKFPTFKPRIESFPWSVMVVTEIQRRNRWRGQSFHSSCGGSLIGDRWVLTAAKCLPPSSRLESNQTRIVVYLGAGQLPIVKRRRSNRTYITRLVELVFHPAKTEPEHKQSGNIVLLRLNETVSFGPKIQPIELNEKLDSDVLKSISLVGGFGRSNRRSRRFQFIKGELSIEQGKCPMIREDVLCGKHRHRLFTNMGNGLMTMIGGKPKLVGIIHKRYSKKGCHWCHSIDVAYYHRWIQSIVVPK